jgi:hypothetical protein
MIKTEISILADIFNLVNKNKSSQEQMEVDLWKLMRASNLSHRKAYAVNSLDAIPVKIQDSKTLVYLATICISLLFKLCQTRRP